MSEVIVELGDNCMRFPKKTSRRFVPNIWLFDLIILFYVDSLSKTRSLLFIKVHEEKNA